MSVPNLNPIAEFVPKLLRGPKISKLGHVAQTTPTYGSFYDPYTGRVRPLCLYQNISSRQLFSFKSYLGSPTISKLGHLTLSYAPFEPETLILCRNPYSHTCCQILCFQLDRLLSNGGEQCKWAILMAKLAMRMRRVTSRDLVVGGHPKNIFGISDPNLPIHYITFTGLR